jgi:hypothetical protein
MSSQHQAPTIFLSDVLKQIVEDCKNESIKEEPEMSPQQIVDQNCIFGFKSMSFDTFFSKYANVSGM